MKGTEYMKQDVAPLTLGGGFLGISSLSDLSTIAEQVGIILGTVLIIITLAHRAFVFYYDIQEKRNEKKK